MSVPASELPVVAPDDHGGLLLYRLWHPATHTPTADTMRTWGPIFRFDPHESTDAAPRHDPDGGAVWYGGEAFETAAREVLDRLGPGVPNRRVDVCVRQRMAAVRLHRPTWLLDLTRHAATIGADSGDTRLARRWRTWGRAR